MPENELLKKSSTLESISRSAARVHGWTQEERQQHHIQAVNLILLFTDPAKLVSVSEDELASLTAPLREIES